MWKKIFACFLCCLLVAVPFIQRSYAAVTTITVVTILILTILTAMGISLVVADGTKEAFIADKGDSFMSSKGYSGSFADWISGGTPMDISLKLGTLMVAKAVVDRVKEFINWLIPSASSDTVVDLSSGSGSTISGFELSYGSIDQNGSITITSSGGFIIAGTNVTSGSNSVYSVTAGAGKALYVSGCYNAENGTPLNLNKRWISSQAHETAWRLLIVESAFIVSGVSYLPGVYIMQSSNSSQTSAGLVWNYELNRPHFFPFTISEVSGMETVDAAAVIDNYDDLSDLTTTTTEGTGGTTIINNTFYITQSGQALNPSSQDLADIVGALQQALDDLEDRMKVQPMTADAEAATQVEPPYNDFQLGNLDLSQLGALLTTRFPFSIPWDLKRIFDLFVVDPEAPHWELNLFADSSLTDAGIDGSVSVDLGNFPIIGTVTRWFCIIEFCLFLAAETKKYIWTA